MSYASRLEEQSDRIWNNIAAENKKVGFITEDSLWSIRKKQIGDVDSNTELDEFQQCVPSPDLERNIYSATKTITILIWIHCHQWDEFPERFCRLTDKDTPDDLQNVDKRLPFKRESVEDLLFPDDPSYADDFFQEQYVFLPIVLEENQKFRSYDSEYRLPLLDDPIDRRGGVCERIVPVKVATGHIRFAKGGEFNSTVWNALTLTSIKLTKNISRTLCAEKELSNHRTLNERYRIWQF